MSNEELVALIQAGDRDRIVELWHQVQRMVYAQATRWAGSCLELGAYMWLNSV